MNILVLKVGKLKSGVIMKVLLMIIDKNHLIRTYSYILATLGFWVHLIKHKMSLFRRVFPME